LIERQRSNWAARESTLPSLRITDFRARSSLQRYAKSARSASFYGSDGAKFMTMTEWVRKELRANYAKASRAGRQAARLEPRAAKAVYRAHNATLQIELTNGASLCVPVKLIPALKRASARDIRAVEVLGRGGGLHWQSLDLDLSVPALVSSVFEGPTWMAELGRMGGRRSSGAKAAAARKNGKKGGRPRLQPSEAVRT
jgi:hypothetical protein